MRCPQLHTGRLSKTQIFKSGYYGKSVGTHTHLTVTLNIAVYTFAYFGNFY